MLKAFADIVRAIRGTTSNSLSDIRPAGQVRYFTDRFNCLLPKDCTLDKLEEEFLAQQIAVMTAERNDNSWHMISQIKDLVTGNQKFGNIGRVMKGILDW